jgi:PIN domain nuclease of toxin-antitoxin system
MVLDASALLTVLLGERGANRVETHLPSASISAVNLSKVVAFGVERGLELENVSRYRQRWQW